MGQVLHGCATMTEVSVEAIQNSRTEPGALSKLYGGLDRGTTKCLPGKVFQIPRILAVT